MIEYPKISADEVVRKALKRKASLDELKKTEGKVNL